MPNKGFVASLFDMSFSSLVTTKVIKLIYAGTLIVLTLVALAMIFVSFHASTALPHRCGGSSDWCTPA